MRKLPRKIIAHFSLELWNNEKGSQIIKTSECGLPNDHFGRLTSVTLVLIIKNKLGSAQVPKFGRLLVKVIIVTQEFVMGQKIKRLVARLHCNQGRIKAGADGAAVPSPLKK